MTLTASELATEIRRRADEFADWCATNAADFGYNEERDYSATPECARDRKALHAAIDRLASLASQSEEQGKDAATPGLLDLVSRIRFAVGDNGKRMQPELVEYLKEMRRDAARYRWLRDSVGYARGAHPMDDHPPHCVFGKFDNDRHVNRLINGAPLDAAVDAAMATPKEGA